MSAEGTLESKPAPSARWFNTTHWTVVLNAGSDDTALASEALGKLCRSYWPPVNAYVRQRGYPAADAEDLTQQFFARFLEKEHYRLAQRERGRFRTFLLTAVKHFLVNERERISALKRGGGQALESLDETSLDGERPRIEPADERTAEQAYEKNWAMTLLARVRDQLAADYAADGGADRFAHLEKFLPGEESDLTYAQAAALLGLSEGTIKSDVHRLKRRYRERLREELAHTVSAPTEIEDELRHLMAVCSRNA
jgi:RNA polymerase sigma factor (sigma-70 family)